MTDPESPSPGTPAAPSPLPRGERGEKPLSLGGREVWREGDRAQPEFLTPDWPAPDRVHAASTTRHGGTSTGAYASLNLSYGSGDDPAAVTENRRRLYRAMAIATPPVWLRQVHGATVVDAAELSETVEADACVSGAPGRFCVVQTADCLPVLFCDRAATVVAAAHAGWRGLVRGVLPATVRAMDCPPAELMAWLGPAIGPEAFEVGPEVRAAFLELDAGNAACFRPGVGDRWMADIHALARYQLNALGVTAIHGGGRCTVSEPEWFFSYRRDGRRSGRMASLIGLR